MPRESDVAVICLLGYDAHKYYTGRGPLESYAEGLEIHDGDLALRVNFATVDKDGKTILDRRVGRNLTTEEAKELAQEINSKVILSSGTFEFRSTIGHRGFWLFEANAAVYPAGLPILTQPMAGKGYLELPWKKFPNTIQESRPVEGYENDPKAIEAAKLLNEWTQKAFRVLQEAQVNKKRAAQGKMMGNAIVSRDAGDCLPKFPNFQKANGLRFGSFVQMPVEKGIALLTGIDVVHLPHSTGNPEVDYLSGQRPRSGKSGILTAFTSISKARTNRPTTEIALRRKSPLRQ